MMGDGVAIDPTGTSLHAPCDGTLVVVSASKHAVTIRAENGAEILLHVGIDTVGLAGEGFELHVREGQTVRAGDRLISFDLDLLARRAKSLITPVLVTDTMGFTISRRSQNCSLRVGDFLMEVLQTADIANADPADTHPGAAHPGVPHTSVPRAGAAETHAPASRADANAAHAASAGATQPGLVERSVLVPLEHGIHARPAATLAAVAKKLNANINIAFGERKANAKSPVALMSLGVRKGDHIVIQASGADAEAAVAALEQAIAGGKDSHAGAATLAVTGGAASAASARRPTSPPSDAPRRGASTTPPPSDAPLPNTPTTSPASHVPLASGTPGVHSSAEASQATGTAPTGAPPTAVPGPISRTGGGPAPNSGDTSATAANAAARAAATPSDRALKGVVASRGLGVGTAFQFARAAIEVPELGAGAAREGAEFDRAREAVRADLERSVSSNNSAAREIAEAHLGLIDDPELIEGARALIEKGKSAGYAWRAVLRDGIEQLRALNDPRMAERADDLLDLETRVLSALSGDTDAGPNFPPESILIANELLPSQLVALDSTKLAGICLAAGGATSHVSIIAAAMDIPTMVATGPGALRIPTGTPVVLDAEAGWLYIDPPRMHVDLARSQLAEKRARRVAEQLAAQRECHTADGTRIEVFANVGSEAEAHAAVRNGAEGSGLLRTEFLFLERTAPPDEAEQLDQYQQIASALEGRPLTIRTLDIGGDKPIPYLPLPHEENPALGLRGVRTSLWRPDLLRIQLRAILRVRPTGQCRILLPMITDVGEIRAIRTMLDELRREEGYLEPIAIGAMIETPASAVMADRIAREADFLSVGTNDLTQYTLAMDRGHSELAARLDALHPAVLRLIASTVAAAKTHGRMVAVCGGLASDPVAVPILIGLGVHELSMVPAVIPQLKALISTLNVDDCTTLANSALERETAEAVRALTLQSVSGLDATGRARE
jgi:phosphocarrier protein FPr/phosphocarrier protein